MLKHHFEIKEVHNRTKTRSKKRLVLIFEEKGYELLSVFLTSEIKNFHNEIITTIERALDSSGGEQRFSGNRCCLESDSVMSTITDLSDNFPLPRVRIFTRELLELVKEWEKNQ